MFELELLELINNLRKSSDDYEIKKIKSSISILIKQNIKKYETFIQTQDLDPQIRQILEEIENEIQNEQTPDVDENDDFSIIKKYYENWLNIYLNNNREVNEENEKIILDLINFYVKNRFEVIEKVLKIKDTTDYDAFKWHIKNQLRVHFGNKIKNYLESDNYKNLSFFSKIKKRRIVNILLNEVCDYKYNIKSLEETLK